MHMRSLILAAALLLPSAALAQTGEHPAPYAMPGEDKVDPYIPSNANAGTSPFAGNGMARAFHGQEGIRRIVGTFVERNFSDPAINDIFKGHDKIRLKRVLFEQFCYILNAGCDYTGRDMKTAHHFMGVQQKDMNKLVENLQAAMREERVSFSAQNKFLAKLAPMRRDVVER